MNLYIFLTENLPNFPELLRFVPYKVIEYGNDYYKIEGFGEKKFPKYDDNGVFIWELLQDISELN